MESLHTLSALVSVTLSCTLIRPFSPLASLLYFCPWQQLSKTRTTLQALETNLEHLPMRNAGRCVRLCAICAAVNRLQLKRLHILLETSMLVRHDHYRHLSPLPKQSESCIRHVRLQERALPENASVVASGGHQRVGIQVSRMRTQTSASTAVVSIHTWRAP